MLFAVGCSKVTNKPKNERQCVNMFEFCNKHTTTQWTSLNSQWVKIRYTFISPTVGKERENRESRWIRGNTETSDF